MPVTCHITFGQLSNFIGASLKVTWTIRNKKLHFTRGCFILLFKKEERGPETRFLLFFFQWFWHLFFWYLNSNHNLPSYSLFLKCCWWFFYPGVYRGAGVFSCFFFSDFSSRAWLALVLASRLPPFDLKTLKNWACSADPGLLNETKGSWFTLSCLSSYQNGW